MLVFRHQTLAGRERHAVGDLCRHFGRTRTDAHTQALDARKHDHGLLGRDRGHHLYGEREHDCQHHRAGRHLPEPGHRLRKLRLRREFCGLRPSGNPGGRNRLSGFHDLFHGDDRLDRGQRGRGPDRGPTSAIGTRSELLVQRERQTSSPATVPGLSPSTSYDYQVAYTDAEPVTVYSATVTATTTAAATTYTVQACDLWDNGYDNVNAPRQSYVSRFIFTTNAASVTINGSTTLYTGYPAWSKLGSALTG